MDSAFIPAFILAENNYSLVQSSGLREEGSAHKTAMSIFGSPASSVAQTPSAASRAALGFFEPTLALMLVHTRQLQTLASLLLVMGGASPGAFRSI